MSPPGLAASTLPTPPRPEEAETEGGTATLYCPGPVRDDAARGETVNEDLVLWAEKVGIYPGQLDRVRAANFGD